VLLFALYTALGFWLVPRLVRSNLVDFAHEQYHRTAKLGDVRFNPLTLKLELRDFSLPDADGAPLVAFDRLLLDFDVSSLWRMGASFANVELDGPFVRALLRPDGSLNLADLAHLANPGPPSSSTEAPRVFIDRLGVSDGRVAFEDRTRSTPFATELRPITFELRDFSTGGRSDNAYSLRAASVNGESFAWSGTQIHVLSPPAGWVPKQRAMNDDSLALLITFGNSGALLAGDLEKKMEKFIAAQSPRADLLKVAHHGSATSTTRELLDAVQPSYSVISAGYRNSFGHPRPVVLQRLQDARVRTYRTDMLGAITFLLDGKSVQVETAARP